MKPRFVPVRFVPLRFAPARFAPNICASSRSASFSAATYRSALLRSAARFAPRRFASLRSARADPPCSGLELPPCLRVSSHSMMNSLFLACGVVEHPPYLRIVCPVSRESCSTGLSATPAVADTYDRLTRRRKRTRHCTHRFTSRQPAAYFVALSRG